MSARILVVDDDRSIQRLLKTCLEYLGCAVDIASSGKEALLKLAETRYQGVLLDYLMPGGMDGLAVLRLVRRTHPTVPVVMMSGNPPSDVVLPALSAGAQTCLLKPFDIAQIEQIVLGWTPRSRSAA
jgi:CheY-like chemotaxis protein